MKRSDRKVNLELAKGTVQEVKTYVTDKDRDLRLDTSLTDPANMQIPARSVVTVVMQLKETLGIQSLPATSTASKNDGRIYNLSGLQVSKADKGIYIKNGKKFVVR